MSEDSTPPTDPAGELVPPINHPPTAVGAAATPPPPPRPMLPRRRDRALTLGSLVEQVLDTLDVVGDTIARVTGLRRTTGQSDS